MVEIGRDPAYPPGGLGIIGDLAAADGQRRRI
jgi:hypothetical protein